MKINDLCVLIIEDNPVFGNLVMNWINKIGVAKVNWVADSVGGLYYAEDTRPDVIFLDNHLPFGKGTELISVLKNKLPDSSIVLMSSHFELEQVSAGVEKGVDYIFQKNNLSKEEIESILNAKLLAIKEKTSIWNILKFKMKSNPDKNARKNISIVEDDRIFSFHLAWYLDELSQNNNICIYDTAEEFYKAGKSNLPDVVFLDYNLPPTTGMDVLKNIKINFPNTKTVMLSSQEDSKIAADLANLGIEAYVTKDKNWKAKVAEVIGRIS